MIADRQTHTQTRSSQYSAPLSAGRHTHTHTRLTALCPGLPSWAGIRKVKPFWISLKQETVSGNGISWAICKSAPRSRLITTPAPHYSVFTGRMPFLPPNQQRQSTEGTDRLEETWNETTSLSPYVYRLGNTSVTCHLDRTWSGPLMGWTQQTSEVVGFGPPMSG